MKTKSRIPTDAEYNRNEYKRAQREWKRIEADPDNDSQLEWFMSHPDGLKLLTKRLIWMLEGCYGRGQQIMAINEAVITIKEGRRGSVGLLFLFAVFECRTTARTASKIWRTLSPIGQDDVAMAIEAAKMDIWQDPDRRDLLNERIKI
jgi:hypothetical protein